MKPVTNSSLLDQLNAGQKPVSDPALLSQLEGGSILGDANAIVSALRPRESAAKGMVETGLQMATGFAGALPGVAAGLYSAATGGEYAPAFKSVQDFYTYEPRTQAGKDISQGIGELLGKYSGAVDRLAENTPGGPLAQTAVKTVGEALPLVAPFVPKLIRGVRGVLKPVADPAVIRDLETKPEPVSPDLTTEAAKPSPATVGAEANSANAPSIESRRMTDTGGTQRIATTDRRGDLAGRIDHSNAMAQEADARAKEIGSQLADAQAKGEPTAELTQQWKAAREEVGKNLFDAKTLRDQLEARRVADQPITQKPVTDAGIVSQLDAPLELTQPTPEGLKAKADAVAEAASTEQQEKAAQEAKATADSQVNDFSLSGSDRPADVDPAQGELPVRELRTRPKLDTQNDSIMVAVRKLGGLRTDFAQDIPATGVNAARAVSGGQYMTHKNGLTTDAMAERLHERGYLESHDINEMFDKLDGEIRAGEPTHFSKEQNIDAYMERKMQGRIESGKFYSGIPLDQAGKTIQYAGEKLNDALGRSEKGVTIEGQKPVRRSRLMDTFRSPSELIKKYPELKPFKNRADRARVEMDTLSDAFGRRLGYVDKQLGGGIKKLADLGKEYRANKTLLNEILLAGDFLGKRFTAEELRARFGAKDNVIKAYVGLRSAYDHALTLANQTRELRGKELVSKREGYVPHFFHDYFVMAGGRIVSSAKSLREAVAMGNELARNGATEIKIAPKQLQFPGEEIQAAVVGDATYFKLQKSMEEAFSMTPEQAKMMLEDIARMRGRSRMVGNFFERKGAPGWEKNLDYAHRHYFNMIARYVALDKFKSSTISNFEMRYGSFDKEHKGIAKYIKDYINDINGVPTKAEELLDNTIMSTPGLSDFAHTFLGKRPSLEIAQATTNAVAIAKLGLYNVSSALVNGSQVIMSQAVLGPRWFAIGAARAVRITAEIAKRKVGFEGTIDQDIGILRQLDVPIQQGLESGGYSATGHAGRLFKISTAFFKGVEFELRATTALGAYYKGVHDGMTKADALIYARDINMRVNFDYSTADAPAFIRRSGPAGQVLFQFKKFPIKAMEFMVNLKGAEVPRFWIPFVLLSGYYAFPGMETIKNLVKGMYGIDIELESKNYLIRWAGDDPQKKAIAKTIFYGAFANDQLGGIDLSRRVGGGDFIPSSISDVFGPFFSSVVRATQMAASEHWAEALKAISSSPGNIAIAIRNNGEITSPWDRDRLTTKLDTKGRVLKGLGFGTVQESTERDTSKVMRYNEGKQRDAEKEAIDGFIKAFTANDQAGIDKAISRFAELGMGEGTGNRIKEEMAKKGMTVSERTFANLRRKGKARQLPVKDFAAP